MHDPGHGRSAGSGDRRGDGIAARWRHDEHRLRPTSANSSPTTPTLGDGSPLGIVTDAAIVVDDGRGRVGRTARAGARRRRSESIWRRRRVIPGFVDSHAHLVFAGDRSAEFAARMSGRALRRRRHRHHRGRNPVGDRRCSWPPTSARLADELRRGGVTTFETKSGYGLSTSDEARSLRVAGEFTSETTFLGAHVVPARVPRRPRRLRATGRRRHARRMPSACPLDRRVLRPRRIRRRRDPRHPGSRHRRRA